MDRHLVIRLTSTIILLLAWTSVSYGRDFIGDESPVIVTVQGKVQRRNKLIRYTSKFNTKGTEPFRRLQAGLCKTVRFRLGKQKFLQDSLINCSLVTVGWHTPWVTLQLAFNRTIIREHAVSAGSRRFDVLLRDVLERYRVCDCLDAFTGRLYIASSCELLSLAAVEVDAVSRVGSQVNHTVLTTEILRRFPPIYAAEAAFRGVFLIDMKETDGETVYTYMFYISEHVLSLLQLDIYDQDFLKEADRLLSRDQQLPTEEFLQEGVISSIDRVLENYLDMSVLLQKSDGTKITHHIDLNFIPEDVICQPKSTFSPAA